MDPGKNRSTGRYFSKKSFPPGFSFQKLVQVELKEAQLQGRVDVDSLFPEPKIGEMDPSTLPFSYGKSANFFDGRFPSFFIWLVGFPASHVRKLGVWY